LSRGAGKQAQEKDWSKIKHIVCPALLQIEKEVKVER